MSSKKNLTFLSHAGSLLSDGDMKMAVQSGLLKIKSPYPIKYQPASVDMHLAGTILVFKRRRIDDGSIDVKEPIDKYVEYEVIDPKKGTVIHPREFILGVTEEWVALPAELLANVDGKSSLGRLGLVIHATAGFIDPGFAGHVTLEITNLTEQPIIVYPGMPIAQIRFSVMSSPAQTLYGSSSLGSKGYKNTYSKNPKPVASQYWKNFK